MYQTVKFDPELLRRHDVNGPRYTSYPTAVQFTDAFGPAEYRAAALRSNDDPIPRPLSLYAHIPFCTSPCFYCACTRIITRDPLKAGLYLERLYREIELQAELFDRDRVVEQLHFGGGTPTFLSMDEMAGLMRHLDSCFNLQEGESREYSIEIDPRTVDAEKIEQLAALGFNRISLGVQDFDRRVQEAVNRVQSVEDTLDVMQAARRVGIGSINLDLIYGLPFQSLEGFGRTLDTVIAARPERLAVYSYAHLPRMFKAQRHIDEAALPDAEAKLGLLRLAIDRLTGAGYVYIGMDHFALPGDELVAAQRLGTLQRNFQGYSTRAECDMIGLGMSSIGKVGDTYSQNAKDIASYYHALDAAQLPVVRGITLTADDRLRREIIQQVMCQGELVFADVERRWGIEFWRYFKTARGVLEAHAADGLIELDAQRLVVTPAGRLLLRVVAMSFDAYAPQVVDARGRFSRIIYKEWAAAAGGSGRMAKSGRMIPHLPGEVRRCPRRRCQAMTCSNGCARSAATARWLNSVCRWGWTGLTSSAWTPWWQRKARCAAVIISIGRAIVSRRFTRCVRVTSRPTSWMTRDANRCWDFTCPVSSSASTPSIRRSISATLWRWIRQRSASSLTTSSPTWRETFPACRSRCSGCSPRTFTPAM